MTPAWQNKLECGNECAKALDEWLRRQKARHPDLRWSDQEAWERCLRKAGINSLLDRFHCLKKACAPFRDRRDIEGLVACPHERMDRCDWWIPEVFNFIAPSGPNLLLLRRYLDADANRHDSIYEEDYTRRLTALHRRLGGPKASQVKAEIERIEGERTKLKVIWSYVVHWLKEKVIPGDRRLYLRWSPEEEVRLRQYRAAGYSHSTIAEKLGRTKPMVASRWRDLNRKPAEAR